MENRLPRRSLFRLTTINLWVRRVVMLWKQIIPHVSRDQNINTYCHYHRCCLFACSSRLLDCNKILIYSPRLMFTYSICIQSPGVEPRGTHENIIEIRYCKWSILLRVAGSMSKNTFCPGESYDVRTKNVYLPTYNIMR